MSGLENSNSQSVHQVPFQVPKTISAKTLCNNMKRLFVFSVVVVLFSIFHEHTVEFPSSYTACDIKADTRIQPFFK